MNGEMFQVIFNSAGLNVVDKADLNNVILLGCISTYKI